MHRAGRASLLLLWCCAVLLTVLQAQAAVPTITVEAFQAQLIAMQQVAANCAHDAAACDRTRVPERETVTGGAGGTFQVGWEWMAEALAAAHHADTGARNTAMHEVAQHLETLGEQSSAPDSLPAGEFVRARTAANATLARAEFRTVTQGHTWWERQLARAQDALLRLLFGMGRLGQRAPWLAPAIEWSCFGLAAAGLLWYVRRSLMRQALRISLSQGATLAGRGAQAAEDWARLAEECAAAGDWREAVHCLYWAAIALLEGRRAWRPNATRTPREYLLFLRPGSEARQALGELTRSLERVWYGQGSADELQYRAALAKYRALEASRPERASADTTSGVAAMPAAGEA